VLVFVVLCHCLAACFTIPHTYFVNTRLRTHLLFYSFISMSMNFLPDFCSK
jgi:hypothetical protein